MTRILLTWELGGNFGHVSVLKAIAQELVAQNFKCVFIVRDVALAEVIGLSELGEVYAAPFSQKCNDIIEPQTSYASTLHNVGFDNVTNLTARLRAWMTLIKRLNVSLIVGNYSPTVVTAARIMDLPYMELSASFSVPRIEKTFAWFNPFLPLSNSDMERECDHVLSVINESTLRLVGRNAFESLKSIFDHYPRYILGIPEMDTYGPDRDDMYLGPLRHSFGADPEWRNNAVSKVFCYIDSIQVLERLLTALSNHDYNVIIKVNGIRASDYQDRCGPTVTVIDTPVNILKAIQQADAIVHCGNEATVVDCLLEGKPSMIIPTTMERLIIANRLKETNAVFFSQNVPTAGEIKSGISKLITEPQFRQAASVIANRYKDIDHSEVPSKAVNVIKSLVEVSAFEPYP